MNKATVIWSDGVGIFNLSLSNGLLSKVDDYFYFNRLDYSKEISYLKTSQSWVDTLFHREVIDG